MPPARFFVLVYIPFCLFYIFNRCIQYILLWNLWFSVQWKKINKPVLAWRMHFIKKIFQIQTILITIYITKQHDRTNRTQIMATFKASHSHASLAIIYHLPLSTSQCSSIFYLYPLIMKINLVSHVIKKFHDESTKFAILLVDLHTTEYENFLFILSSIFLSIALPINESFYNSVLILLFCNKVWMKHPFVIVYQILLQVIMIIQLQEI